MTNEKIEGEPAANEKPDVMVTTATADEVEGNLQDARRELTESRIALPQALDRQRVARNILSQAISSWQNINGTIRSGDREALVREHIASENQARRERIEGRGASARQSQPGPSAVDRAAFYGRPSSPAQGNWRRGAHPASHRGRRVPSER